MFSLQTFAPLGRMFSSSGSRAERKKALREQRYNRGCYSQIASVHGQPFSCHFNIAITELSPMYITSRGYIYFVDVNLVLELVHSWLKSHSMVLFKIPWSN